MQHSPATPRLDGVRQNVTRIDTRHRRRRDDHAMPLEHRVAPTRLDAPPAANAGPVEVDAFLEAVFGGLERGTLDRLATQQLIAHVMRCLTSGRHDEARTFVAHVIR